MSNISILLIFKMANDSIDNLDDIPDQPGSRKALNKRIRSFYCKIICQIAVTCLIMIFLLILIITIARQY